MPSDCLRRTHNDRAGGRGRDRCCVLPSRLRACVPACLRASAIAPASSACRSGAARCGTADAHGRVCAGEVDGRPYAKRPKVESTPDEEQPLALLSFLAGAGAETGSILASSTASHGMLAHRGTRQSTIRPGSRAPLTLSPAGQRLIPTVASPGPHAVVDTLRPPSSAGAPPFHAQPPAAMQGLAAQLPSQGAATSADSPQTSSSTSSGAMRGDRPHKCPVKGCNYSAKGTGHLKRHIRTHTGEKPFKCPWDDCPYASSQSTHLTAHMRKHTGERPFNCPVAGCSKYLSAHACTRILRPAF